MANSYNGWSASPNPADFGGLTKLVVAGEPFSPGVRSGDVHTVLQYVAEQLHRRVEPVVAAGWHQADDWGFNYRANRNNPNSLSCHASATAIDYNATRHPNGKRGTFTAGQVAEIRKILKEVGGVVRWGGDFTGTPDEMHFEINADAARVAGVARSLRGGGPAPSTGGVIKKGDRGVEVRALQILLITHLNSPAFRWNVTDFFGDTTEKAVREFQRRNGLGVDGIVGPRTRAKLGMR